MSKYLIWDFDGTLGYREGGWIGATVEVLRQYAPKCEATADHVRPHLQRGFRWHDPDQSYGIKGASQWWDELSPIFERAFTAVGIETSLAKCMAQEVRFAYAGPKQWRLYEDTISTLNQLSGSGWTHLMLSNHVPELSDLLGHLAVRNFFAQVFNSAETGYEKPHPEAYRAVLKSIADAESLWMIGDNAVADIEGAAAVGIPGILVRKQHPNALYQCDNLSQVEAVLRSELSPKVTNINKDEKTDC